MHWSEALLDVDVQNSSAGFDSFDFWKDNNRSQTKFQFVDLHRRVFRNFSDIKAGLSSNFDRTFHAEPTDNSCLLCLPIALKRNIRSFWSAFGRFINFNFFLIFYIEFRNLKNQLNQSAFQRWSWTVFHPPEVAAPSAPSVRIVACNRGNKFRNLTDHFLMIQLGTSKIQDHLHKELDLEERSTRKFGFSIITWRNHNSSHFVNEIKFSSSSQTFSHLAILVAL